MNITEEVSFDKEGHIYPASAMAERFPLVRSLFLSVVIILVALLSFGIGRLSVAGDREPIKIEYDQNLTKQSATVINVTGKPALPSTDNGAVVVSKNGSRYHFPHCSGAKQIKEENKIVFPTPEAAEAAGYTLAANCSPR